MKNLTFAYLLTHAIRAASRHPRITLVVLVLLVALAVQPQIAPAFLTGLTGGAA